MKKSTFFVCALFLATACAQSGDYDNPDDSNGNKFSSSSMEPLAWESSSNPERAAWSRFSYGVIDDVFNQLDQVEDAEIFCPSYRSLSRDRKINFWGQLIAGMSYYESGWNPLSRMQESTFSAPDDVTGKPVYSEGLLQLSYGDIEWAPYCEFDWSHDKNLSPKDPNKTILNPEINLNCGIRILADQIARKHEIALKSGVYWAVLKEGGKYSQINSIAKITKRLSFCD